MKVRCEHGVVEVVVLEEQKKAYVLCKPLFAESCERVVEELMKQGYKVMKLNAGVEEELQVFEEVERRYCS